MTTMVADGAPMIGSDDRIITIERGTLMNDNIVTFHKTVRGYRHIQEDLPCQDSSTSYVLNKEDGYQIISVADGHGDPACHRSDKGSKFAVEKAENCLKEFAGFLLSGDMPFDNPRQQNECMEQLTNTIISQWYGAVRNDLHENKISEEDFMAAGRYEEAYRKGEKLEHLYGTTLIAVLRVKDYLILIQQGDGRCDVFYADGTVDQPIPWDSRCKGSTTTSLCDKDVFVSIRKIVIDLTKKDVIACFVGSDGVEDSYFDNEESQLGTHRFYMDLCCKLCEYGTESFKAYLDDRLPDFSRDGSGDDISVAGIVVLDKTIQQVDSFAEKVKQYDKEAKLKMGLEEARSKVISMTRKHGILSKRVADAEAALTEAQKAKQACENGWHILKVKSDLYEKQKVKLEEALNGKETAIHELELKLEAAKNEFTEYDKRYRFNQEEQARLEKELMELQGG